MKKDKTKIASIVMNEYQLAYWHKLKRMLAETDKNIALSETITVKDKVVTYE